MGTPLPEKTFSTSEDAAADAAQHAPIVACSPFPIPYTVRKIISLPLVALLTLVVKVACSSVTWSAEELAQWYGEYAQDSPYYSELWYLGTDENYHYFRCRAIDSSVLPRVPREEVLCPTYDHSKIAPFLAITRLIRNTDSNA